MVKKNKEKALKILRSKLFEMERQKQEARRSMMRMQQVGTGMRNERIRTYNFPQSRVTDHRCNHSAFDIARMMNGELLDEFVEKMVEFEDNESVEFFARNPDSYISF